MKKASDDKATYSSSELLEVLYRDLHRLAANRMARELPGHSFRATDLVHEAYLRLVKDGVVGWDSRGHFYAAAAISMRRILVERARKRQTARRDGSALNADTIQAPADPDPLEILSLDEALTKFAEGYPQHADVVHLRFFAGLTIAETARVLEVSTTTVENRWAFARSWLYVAMADRSV